MNAATWIGVGMVIASAAITSLNAWQTKCVQLEIEKLRGALIERIARAEGQLAALTAVHGEK